MFTFKQYATLNLVRGDQYQFPFCSKEQNFTAYFRLIFLLTTANYVKTTKKSFYKLFWLLETVCAITEQLKGGSKFVIFNSGLWGTESTNRKFSHFFLDFILSHSHVLFKSRSATLKSTYALFFLLNVLS